MHPSICYLPTFKQPLSSDTICLPPFFPTKGFMIEVTLKVAPGIFWRLTRSWGGKWTSNCYICQDSQTCCDTYWRILFWWIRFHAILSWSQGWPFSCYQLLVCKRAIEQTSKQANEQTMSLRLECFDLAQGNHFEYNFSGKQNNLIT